MVGVNPVLSCLMRVEEGLSRGDSVRDSVLDWISNSAWANAANRSDHMRDKTFEEEVLRFLRQTESAHGDVFVDSGSSKSVLRQSLFNILHAGHAGQTVLPRLQELRGEIEQQLELDLKTHVESLPLKMLVPLLVLMFPAFLILLLGPITRHFTEALR